MGSVGVRKFEKNGGAESRPGEMPKKWGVET
jgi:hypothetical protein